MGYTPFTTSDKAKPSKRDLALLLQKTLLKINQNKVTT